ncbi:recombinase family protein [Anaerorhabdus sp.]
MLTENMGLEDLKTLPLSVAIYCRVSTKHEIQESSLKWQEKRLRDIVDSNPFWNIVGVYAETSSAINIMKQRKLQELRNKCLNKEVDLMIVKDITRLSRNTIQMLILVRELIDNDVTIYFDITKIIINKFHREGLLLTLHCAFAQQEVENMSKSIRWGNERKYEQGIQPRNTKCLGYDYDDNGNLIINSSEAKIVYSFLVNI